MCILKENVFVWSQFRMIISIYEAIVVVAMKG
jgi:hypothetical protein